jgi:hypothetical protein
VTEIVHVIPGFTYGSHVFVCEKSPVRVSFWMYSRSVPGFVILMFFGELDAPRSVLGNLSLVPLIEKAGNTPKPLRLACWEPASPLTDSVPDRVPEAVGWKVTEMVQDPPTATEPTHVLA